MFILNRKTNLYYQNVITVGNLLMDHERDKIFNKILTDLENYVKEHEEGVKIKIARNKQNPSLNDREFVFGPAEAMALDGVTGIIIVELGEVWETTITHGVIHVNNVPSGAFGFCPYPEITITSEEALTLFKLLGVYLVNWKIEKEFPIFSTVGQTVH